MANHIFLGWFYDTACQQPVDYNSTVNGDLKLFAGWHQTFRVTFEADGGTFPGGAVTRTQDVRMGWTVPQPTENETPTKNGDTFLYWYDTASTTTYGLHPRYDFSTPVIGPLFLRAQWLSASGGDRPAYQIRYSVNGTSYQSYDALFGDPIPKPDDPSVDGYIFTGWHWTGDPMGDDAEFDFTGKTAAGNMDFNAMLLSSSDDDLVDIYYMTKGNNLTDDNIVEFVDDWMDDTGSVLWIKQNGNYNIRSPKPTDTRIQIDIGLTVTITLTDVVIMPTSGMGTNGNAIDIEWNSTVNLIIAGTNVLSGKSLNPNLIGYGYDMPSIDVFSNSTLNITGDGTLKADSFYAYAGIMGGTINISGGNVIVARAVPGRTTTPYGENDVYESIYGTVRITGGSVTAPTIGGSLNISSPGRFTGKGPDGKVYENSHLPNP
jgi:hypothetical protein